MKHLSTICRYVILCACFSLGGQASGATFGNNAGTTYNTSLESQSRGGKFTLTEDGIAESITVYLTVGTVADTVRCMIYDTDSVLIATTEVKIVPVQTATATTFNFNYTVNLAAGDYFLMAWGGTTAGTCFIGRNFAGSGTSISTVDVLTSYPRDPHASNVAPSTLLYRIYCTYTAGEQLTLGRTTIGTSTLSIKQQIAGGIFTTPATAISVSSVTPHVIYQSAAGETDTMMCAIYKQSDLSLVDTTYQIKFTGDTAVAGALRLWREFTFPSAPTLAASTDYVFCVWAGHFSSSANIRLTTSGGQGMETDPETFDGTFPDPMADNTVANWYGCVFVDYTEVAATPGIPGRRRKIILGDPLGLVQEATETFAGNKDDILY